MRMLVPSKPTEVACTFQWSTKSLSDFFTSAVSLPPSPPPIRSVLTCGGKLELVSIVFELKQRRAENITLPKLEQYLDSSTEW